MLQPQARVRFEQLVLPHLDSAFNLAHWLLRSPSDADDLAQEAILRAYRFFEGFRGGDARAWLLQIVRNTCYSWLEKNRSADLLTEFDEEQHFHESASPEALALAGEDRSRLKRALESLPLRTREILILRELEGCSYKEISEVVGIPMGTVMSSLSRARERLRHLLTMPANNARAEETSHEL